MSVFRRALERRSILPGPWDGTALTIPAPGTGGRWSTSGQHVDETSSLGIVALFAGVRIIADAVATTPIRAVTVNPDGTRKPVIPSPQVVVNPFQAFTLHEGISQIVTSLLLRGNSYMYVVATDPVTFRPSTVRVMHPDQVQVSWDSFGSRQYRVGGRIVPPTRILHVTGFMLPNSLKGVGVIEHCRNALGIGMALEDVAGQFFENGIMATGIISTDVPLTDDQARQTGEMFSSRHAGANKSFLPVVLGGGAKFQPISLTLEDAQFLQSRRFTSEQIATLLGVPPHLLGIVDKTTSWGTGIEAQGRNFVDYSLRSYFVRLQNLFSWMLPDGVFADFITDAITRADTATRYANYALALGANNGIGWMNVDTVRALEGLPPLPDALGQQYYVAAASVAVTSPTTSAPSTPAPAIIPPTDPATGESNVNPTN
jgi:HK97 family phage portal protein